MPAKLGSRTRKSLGYGVRVGWHATDKVAGSFVDATRSQTLEFYRQIVQQVRPWAAAAPKLPAEKVAIPEDKPVSIPPAGEALPVED